MVNYAKHVSKKKTPQTEEVLGKKQVQNNAGGFVFALDNWKRLERFLILGAEGNTFYVSEHKMAAENAKAVIECIKEDGLRAVKTILDTSDDGKAPKNDPAIFALALAATFGNEDTKQAAYAAIPKVCRTGTFLFTFCQAVQDLRGWSRGLRKGVSRFYVDRDAKSLAYQLIKYRQRNGWTHKDVIRLSHPKGRGLNSNLLGWAIGKENVLPSASQIGGKELEAVGLIEAFDKVQAMEKEMSENASKVNTNPPMRLIRPMADLIAKHKLPWEALPTIAMRYPEIWEALLPDMPPTALIRNLGRLAAMGLTKSNLDDHSKLVAAKLTDKEAIKKGRVHPLTLLNALKTYSTGHGDKSSLTWKPVGLIKDALEEAFYLAFDAIEPTGKNWLLGLDVSGSMSGGQIGGMNISPCEAVATMAMVTARVEKSSEIYGFTSTFQDLGITAKDNLESVLKKVQKSNFGTTDCAQPMLYASKEKLKVDAFVVLTDNETYAGNIHPFQALKDYRSKFNPQAKLIVVGMTATEFSIADPSDQGMLDVAGFSTSAPAVMANFVREKMA